MSHHLQRLRVIVGTVTLLALTGLTSTLRATEFFSPAAKAQQTMAQPLSTTQPLCATAPAARLSLNMYGVVAPTPKGQTPLPVRIHAQPDSSSPAIGSLSDGAEFLVIGGPVCNNNNFYWWKVVTVTGDIGWLAEGDASGYFVDPVLGFPPPVPVTPVSVTCPNAPATQLATGMSGVVPSAGQATTSVHVRVAAGLQSPIVANLVPGDQFVVTDGPQCVDGFIWWKIQAENNVVGWVAEGDKTGYFVVPIVLITAPTPTPTTMPTNTPTATLTATPTSTTAPTLTPSNTSMPTATLTSSPTSTITPTPTASKALTPSATFTANGSATAAPRVLNGTDIVYNVAWSPDGKTLATTTTGGTVTLWDVSDQRPRTLHAHNSGLNSVAWSPDGKMLAAGGGFPAGVVELWDVATGQNLDTLRGPTQSVRSVAWSPDGKTLAASSNDKTVELWDVATGQSVRVLSGHTDVVTSVAWSPDGRTLASASWDRTVRLWDAATGQSLRTFGGYSSQLFSVAWSPDGKTLAVADGDRTVRVVDAASGGNYFIFTGHTGAVNSVAWSPDGRTVASGSWDQTVRLWNVRTGRNLRILSGHSGSVFGVAWSPDGKTLASGSWDQTVRLWDVSDLAGSTRSAPTPAVTNATAAPTTMGTSSSVLVTADLNYGTDLTKWGVAFYLPNAMQLASIAPSAWQLPPPGSNLKRYYGNAKFGDKSQVNAILDIPTTGTASTDPLQLWLAFDSDTNFTNKTPIQLARTVNRPDVTSNSGPVEFSVSYGDGSTQKYSIELYAWLTAPATAHLAFYRASLREGTLAVNGLDYPIAVIDEEMSNAKFDDLSNDIIVVDSQRNGLITLDEQFRASKTASEPILLGNQYYTVVSVSPSGTQITLRPAVNGTVQGTVTSRQSGKPIANATIIFMPSKLRATTDGNGHYTLSLPEGSYTGFVCTAEGYVPFRRLASVTIQPLVVRAGATALINVSLAEPTKNLAGHLRLTNGESYHFLEGRAYQYDGGDFYVVLKGQTASFYANNLFQLGVQDLGDIGNVPLDQVSIPTGPYSQFETKAVVGHTYVSIAEQDEGYHHIVFRVTNIQPGQYVEIDFQYR